MTQAGGNRRDRSLLPGATVCKPRNVPGFLQDLSLVCDPAQFSQEAFELLPDGIGGISIRSVPCVQGAVVELVIDKQVQFGVGDESLRDTAIEEVSKEYVPFKGVVFRQGVND